MPAIPGGSIPRTLVDGSEFAFERSFQTTQRLVPALRNPLERTPCLGQRRRLQLPELFAALARTAREATVAQYLHVLGDRLAGNASAVAETSDGEWPFPAEAVPQPRLRHGRPSSSKSARGDR